MSTQEVDPVHVSELVMTLYRGTEDHSEDGFKDWALDKLRDVLPFDSAFWAEGVDMGKVIFDAHLYGTPRSADEWLADYSTLKADDPLAAAVTANFGVTIYDIDIMPREEWLSHPEFGPFCRKHEIQYTLCTADHDPTTTLIEVISIYRANPDRPYSESERRRMQFLFPHLLEARRRNALLNVCFDGEAGNWNTASTAVCDGSGSLRYADERFVSLLRESFPDWSGPRLPKQFASALKRTEGEFLVSEADTVFRIRESGELYLLSAAHKSAVDMLTPRERQVARLLVAGGTYQVGAESLGIAVSTFNKHAHQIYKKLGVENRAALVVCLGGETDGKAGT